MSNNDPHTNLSKKENIMANADLKFRVTTQDRISTNPITSPTKAHQT